MADTAAYYADKLVTFSNFDREAVLLLAKVSGQIKQAASVIDGNVSPDDSTAVQAGAGGGRACFVEGVGLEKGRKVHARIIDTAVREALMVVEAMGGCGG